MDLESFFEAVKHDRDFALVTSFLMGGVLLDARRPEDGATALHVAVLGNEKGRQTHMRMRSMPEILDPPCPNQLIIAFLIDNGADVNAHTTSGGETPLMLAAAAQNLRAVKLLLAKGAALDACDHLGRTCLFYAAQYPHVLQTLQVFVGTADSGKSLLPQLARQECLLHHVCRRPGSRFAALYLIEQLGMDVNAREGEEEKQEEQNTEALPRYLTAHEKEEKEACHVPARASAGVAHAPQLRARYSNNMADETTLGLAAGEKAAASVQVCYREFYPGNASGDSGDDTGNNGKSPLHLSSSNTSSCSPSVNGTELRFIPGSTAAAKNFFLPYVDTLHSSYDVGGAAVRSSSGCSQHHPTPLECAIGTGDALLVRSLLRCGARVQAEHLQLSQRLLEDDETREQTRRWWWWRRMQHVFKRSSLTTRLAAAPATTPPAAETLMRILRGSKARLRYWGHVTLCRGLALGGLLLLWRRCTRWRKSSAEALSSASHSVCNCCCCCSCCLGIFIEKSGKSLGNVAAVQSLAFNMESPSYTCSSVMDSTTVDVADVVSSGDASSKTGGHTPAGTTAAAVVFSPYPCLHCCDTRRTQQQQQQQQQHWILKGRKEIVALLTHEMSNCGTILQQERRKTNKEGKRKRGAMWWEMRRAAAATALLSSAVAFACRQRRSTHSVMDVDTQASGSSSSSDYCNERAPYEKKITVPEGRGKIMNDGANAEREEGVDNDDVHVARVASQSIAIWHTTTWGDLAAAAGAAILPHLAVFKLCQWSQQPWILIGVFVSICVMYVAACVQDGADPACLCHETTEFIEEEEEEGGRGGGGERKKGNGTSKGDCVCCCCRCCCYSCVRGRLTNAGAAASQWWVHPRPRRPLRAVGWGIGFITCIGLHIWYTCVDYYFAVYSFHFDGHKALTHWLAPSAMCAFVMFCVVLSVTPRLCISTRLQRDIISEQVRKAAAETLLQGQHVSSQPISPPTPRFITLPDTEHIPQNHSIHTSSTPWKRYIDTTTIQQEQQQQKDYQRSSGCNKSTTINHPHNNNNDYRTANSDLHPPTVVVDTTTTCRASATMLVQDSHMRARNTRTTAAVAAAFLLEIDPYEQLVLHRRAAWCPQLGHYVHRYHGYFPYIGTAVGSGNEILYFVFLCAFLLLLLALYYYAWAFRCIVQDAEDTLRTIVPSASPIFSAVAITPTSPLPLLDPPSRNQANRQQPPPTTPTFHSKVLIMFTTPPPSLLTNTVALRLSLLYTQIALPIAIAFVLYYLLHSVFYLLHHPT